MPASSVEMTFLDTYGNSGKNDPLSAKSTEKPLKFKGFSFGAVPPIHLPVFGGTRVGARIHGKEKADEGRAQRPEAYPRPDQAIAYSLPKQRQQP